MGDSVRVFIAVELNQESKKYLHRIQQYVLQHSLKGNFTRMDNFHLTLKFIGEVGFNDLPRLQAAVANTAQTSRSFTIGLGGLGEFPRGNKSILWVGIKNGYQMLAELHDRLETNLEQAGYAREGRGLRPHITLGREVLLREPLDAIAGKLTVINHQIRVHKLTLMESTRMGGVLTYLPLYTCDFKG